MELTHDILPLIDDNLEEATYKPPLEVCHEEKRFGHPFDVRDNYG